MTTLPARRRLSLRALKYACLSPALFRVEQRLPFGRFTRRLRAARTEVREAAFVLRNRYAVDHGQAHAQERFVVCADIGDLYSGLGVCLLLLGPCWKFALKTGRTLVIDWRGNPYTRTQPRTNLFAALFEPPDPSEIGVACIADDSVNDLRLPQPILAPAGAFPQESGEIHRFPGAGLDTRSMRRVIAGGLNVDFPTILPSLATLFPLARELGPLGSHWPPVFTLREGRRLYRSLKLRPAWAASVSDFERAHMSDRPVVGVHVRHGNGEGASRGHFRHREIEGVPAFLESLALKVERYATGRFGKRFTVFLCTDSDEVVEILKPRFDSLVSRRIWRPPPGQGIDFDHAYRRADGGVQAAADALVDMRLLAKCDAVILARPTEFASHVPYLLEKPGAVVLDHEQTARL